jgi:hypothetical protein
VDTGGKKKKRTSKENVDGRCTIIHGNKTFRSRSVVKQKGMVFGFRKTATGIVGPEIELYNHEGKYLVYPRSAFRTAVLHIASSFLSGKHYHPFRWGKAVRDWKRS